MTGGEVWERMLLYTSAPFLGLSATLGDVERCVSNLRFRVVSSVWSLCCAWAFCCVVCECFGARACVCVLTRRVSRAGSETGCRRWRSSAGASSTSSTTRSATTTCARTCSRNVSRLTTSWWRCTRAGPSTRSSRRTRASCSRRTSSCCPSTASCSTTPWSSSTTPRTSRTSPPKPTSSACRCVPESPLRCVLVRLGLAALVCLFPRR